MKQGIFTITKNVNLTRDVMLMTLKGDATDITKPGQFINIKLDGKYLRRPISVCFATDNEITIIYKVVGHGTEQMRNMAVGEKLDVLTGLGNGYDVTLSGDNPLLIGGGVGIPPLYGLCKELVAMGKKPTVILGFNTESEIFYEEVFKLLGADVFVTTVDGSYGIKGFVTNAKGGDAPATGKDA